MKSVKVNACNCEQIMVSVQTNGNCKAEKVSNTETEVSITAIATVLSDVKVPATPAYMPEGFKYLDGSIESKDYRISDDFGNIFTWVSERTLKSGDVVEGFWISSFEISQAVDGSPRSVEDELPWVNITRGASEQAKKFGGRLLYSKEWDAICEECAEIIGEYKVYRDSTEIGNYWNSDGSTQELERTGKHVICGISNLAGNCWTWTNDDTNHGEAIIRGSSYYSYGWDFPMCSRSSYYRYGGNNNIGFRIVL